MSKRKNIHIKDMSSYSGKQKHTEKNIKKNTNIRSCVH